MTVADVDRGCSLVDAVDRHAAADRNLVPLTAGWRVCLTLYLASAVSTATLIACTPVLIDGSSTGAKKGE
jgi:hypothetical protein